MTLALDPTVPPIEKNLSAAPSECADQYSRRARQRGGARGRRSVGASAGRLLPSVRPFYSPENQTFVAAASDSSA